VGNLQRPQSYKGPKVGVDILVAKLVFASNQNYQKLGQINSKSEKIEFAKLTFLML
jgi:hypothetical protein